MIFVTKPVELQIRAHTETKFYSGPWHGKTTQAGASVAAEMEPLHELEEGAVKNTMDKSREKSENGPGAPRP